MKKKIVAAIMCIALGITSLAGCGKVDLKESLGTILEKDHDNVDMELSAKIVMDAAGIQMTIPLEMKAKTIHANTEDMLMEAKMHTEVGGQKMDMEMYYADGYYYMDTSGTKIKYPMNVTDFEKEVGNTLALQQLSANMLEEVTMEEDGDTQVFSFKATMGEEENGMLKDLLSFADNNPDKDLGFEYSGIEGTVTVKDGVMQQIDMNYELNVNLDGQEIKATAETTTKINATGDDVTITPPNPDEYTEVDPTQM